MSSDIGSVDAVKTWLQGRRTATMDHPGGTLYTHLVRVHDRMRALGLRDDVCLAGLAHAAYGTDGFPVALLDWADRDPLRDLVGDAAEALVPSVAADAGAVLARL